jgi:hypothetical protein
MRHMNRRRLNLIKRRHQYIEHLATQRDPASLARSWEACERRDREILGASVGARWVAQHRGIVPW